MESKFGFGALIIRNKCNNIQTKLNACKLQKIIINDIEADEMTNLN